MKSLLFVMLKLKTCVSPEPAYLALFTLDTLRLTLGGVSLTSRNSILYFVDRLALSANLLTKFSTNYSLLIETT